MSALCRLDLANQAAAPSETFRVCAQRTAVFCPGDIDRSSLLLLGVVDDVVPPPLLLAALVLLRLAVLLQVAVVEVL